MRNLPTLSIIIAIRNVERTFPRLLQNLSSQNYPKNKMEIIVVDGRSTDKTFEIIKKSHLKIRIIQGKYPNDPEACKGEGLQAAKGEIVGLIDSDNYLPNKKWLEEMVIPLIDNKKLVGSYPWRFAYRKKDNLLNRYFSLIGSCDPVGLYLGKADKMSYMSENWNIAGKILENNSKYYVVQFNEQNFPTLGSNGFFARRKYLLKGKSDIKHFFHIDTPFDLLKFQLNSYAAVKDVVIHDTAVTLLSFVVKRAKYMMLHYQKRAGDRRYFVFDPKRSQDIFHIVLFIIFSLTFLQPIFVALRGYWKVRDVAWFVHPIICFALCVGYMYTIALKRIKG